MALRVGIDLVSVGRIKKAISRTSNFKAKTFAEIELNYAKNKAKEVETLAGIFAAKEAFLKAIEVGVLNGIKLSEVVVAHNSNGAPQLKIDAEILKQYNIKKANISISHDGENAIAICILD